MRLTFLDYLLSTTIVAALVYFVFKVFFKIQSDLEAFTGFFFPVAAVLFGVSAFGLACLITLLLLKKLLPIKDGEYPMKSREFTRWKVEFILEEFAFHCLKWFFPIFVRSGLFRLFEAKIGFSVIIAGRLDGPGYIEIGNNSILGRESCISTHYLTNNRFVLKRIHIGQRVTIGERALVLPGVTIEDEAVITPGSVVMPGTQILARELWTGNPARKIMTLPENPIIQP